MTGTIRVLAAAHDPGGAVAMRPVLRLLRRNPSVELLILASSYAHAVFSRDGIECEDMPTTFRDGAAREWIASQAPHILFSGTSWAAGSEQQLRNEAAAVGLPSLVLLDYWSNYRSRWIGATYGIEELKDFVAAMDDECRAEMIAAGFPPEKIITTGHPHVEELFSAPAPPRNSPARACTILFISLPLPGETLHGTPQQHVVAIGKILARIAAERGTPVRLAVKLHPKEGIEHWPEAIELAGRSGIEVRLHDGKTNLDELTAESQVVIGFASMALILARAAGKRVLALEELDNGGGLRSMYRNAGIRWCGPDAAAVGEALAVAMALPPYDPPPGELYRRAAQNVEELLLRCAADNAGI